MEFGALDMVVGEGEPTLIKKCQTMTKRHYEICCTKGPSVTLAKFATSSSTPGPLVFLLVFVCTELFSAGIADKLQLWLSIYFVINTDNIGGVMLN